MNKIFLFHLKGKESIKWTSDSFSTFARQCDFPGNDIYCIPSGSVKYCVSRCFNDKRCTAYIWFDYNGGTCCGKHYPRNTASAVVYSAETSQCGVITSMNIK